MWEGLRLLLWDVDKTSALNCVSAQVGDHPSPDVAPWSEDLPHDAMHLSCSCH